MTPSGADWRSRLAKLPTTTHVAFSQEKHRYWVANWLEQGEGRHLYIGVQAPDDHPCFERRCGHLPRKPGRRGLEHPAQEHPQRKGRVLGYRPGPETIERQRATHIGKAGRGPQRKEKQPEGNLQRMQARPRYIEVADQLAEELRQGRYSPGQPLPPAEITALRLTVGVNTVELAYLLLVQRSLAYKAAKDFIVRQPRPKC